MIEIIHQPLIADLFARDCKIGGGAAIQLAELAYLFAG
jgi:hypothetical protein